jgi:hypothetical protein
MRISVIMISAASLLALGGIAKADDHLFQATQSGGLIGDASSCCSTRTDKSLPDSPGKGSPFTSFSGETGVPSVDEEQVPASENGAHDLPASAGPKK